MRKFAFRLSSLVLLPLSLLLFSCSTQRNAPQLIVPAGKQGLVHGGQQPVSAATIQLYAVGSTGDGSASTPLLSPAAVSDANGGFNISGTYTCPSPSALVYIVASGGNPGLTPGTNNAALSMMAALGPCGSLSPSTFIFIDELTTVAAVYSLAPFITSPSAIGSAPADAAALADAFTLASELANTTTGTTPGTGVPPGTSVPVSQINTIADIVAACINSGGGVSGDSSPCGTLFSLTTPTGLTPATDTITALLHLANDPALNTASLYDLVTPTSPFQPVQPQTPPDLSVHLTVSSGFTVSTTVLNFPATRIFTTSAPLTVTLTNNTAAPVGIDTAGLSSSFSGANPGDFSGGVFTGMYCGTPVMPGTSCTLQFVFRPQATGARSAYVTLINTSANPAIPILMTGEGLEASAGPASLTPVTGLAFTAAGTTSTATLTGSGTQPLTIDSITISNDPNSGQPAFTQTNNCGASLAPPATCTITVTALSTTQAYSTGVLTVGDDAVNGPQTLNLSYSNGFSGGPVLADFGSRSVGTQGIGGLDFQPPGIPPGGTYTLTLTGPAATDFSFLPDSSSLSTTCTAGRLNPYCVANLYFTPSALGLRTATVNVNGTPKGGVVGIGLSAGVHFAVSLNSFNFPVSPISLSFSVVAIGQTSPAQRVFVNNTGSVPLTLNAPVLSGPGAADFNVLNNNCTTLALNATCSFSVTASPTQPTFRDATLTLSDSTAAAQQTISLSVLGTNPPPVANPPSLSFSYTPLGTTSAAQPFTVTSFNNDPITVRVANSAVSPFVLTQGSSCAVTPCQIFVAYAPTTATTAQDANGNSFGGILITDIFSGKPFSVSAMGTWQPPPPPTTTATIQPGVLSFNAQSVGTTSGAADITITNTGNQPLTNQISFTGTNVGDFIFTNPCPSTIAVGGQCSLTIAFAPTATGTRTANVQIIANTSNLESPIPIEVIGTGQ